jgi:hypothetical protein
MRSDVLRFGAPGIGSRRRGELDRQPEHLEQNENGPETCATGLPLEGGDPGTGDAHHPREVGL